MTWRAQTKPSQTAPQGRMLRRVVLVIVLLGLLLPILAGSFETLRAAFGLHPGIGATRFGLAPWQSLAALPGFATALRLTLFTGIGSTLLALLLATGFCALMHGRVSARQGDHLLTPILAVPHAAIAIGLAFLIAPSGWVARLIAPLAGWTTPPAIASVNDSYGLALLLGLIVKELPFLLLVILAALSQLPVNQQLSAGRALGYSRGIVWIKLIMPQVWPLIRLPVLVVQAYALSVVDMAVILGPSNPPTLAVAVTRWFANADVQMILPASAGAVLIALLTLATTLLWLLAERVVRAVGLWWLRRGGRGLSTPPGLLLTASLAAAALAVGLLSLLALLIWSVTHRWSFPHPLPESWSWQTWQAAAWAKAAAYSLLLACTTTLIATTLAIAWLEAEDRSASPRARWATALIYLPLLLPQIAFLYGLNLLFLRLGLSGGLSAVIWGHSLFVFPYVMIALSDPWRALDPALIRSAASLGAGPNRRLFAIKLPVLLAPILTAAAIGFAVSIAQYLPTLFLGAGRIATLTTEAVTLSASADRRIVGTYASLQAALPFAAYALALALPRLIFRNRRALLGGYA